MESQATRTKVSQTALVRSIRHLEQYQVWKRNVFLRDHFECQLCGRRNGRKRVIEADHIISLAELVRSNHITTLDEARACFALWDIRNGRTLCHSCHEKTESYPVNFRAKPGVVERTQWL